MDILQISLLISVGLYFLVMVAASLYRGKNHSRENFIIADRQAGLVPIISSLAASFLFILVPLYVAVGFGWLTKTKRIDAMISISMLISLCVYLVMYLRGDFANMLMVPVLVNTVMMAIVCGYECYGQKSTVTG